MPDVVENGTEQPTQGLPAVTSEDVRPQKGGETQGGAKSDKNQDTSQPRQQDAGAKDKGPGPWSQKLMDAGLDDPRFDEFLRAEIQPYITQLEQGRGGGSQIWNGDSELEQSAYEMVQAFRTDPIGAYQELGEILGITGEQPADDMDFSEDFDSLGEENQVDPRMQYVDDLMRKEQEQREDAEYDQFLKELGNRIPGFNADMYTMVLAATPEGDLDLAYQTYMQKVHPSLAQPTAPPDAPPQLGGTEGGTAPPEAPEYDSIGSALDSFLSEERARKQRL